MTEPELVPARTGGWLRRNLGSLAVTVVSAAGCVVVLVVLPLLDQASRAEAPTDVPFGESVTSGGYEFELLDSAEFPGTGDEGNGVPIGMALVGAIIEVRPVGDADPELYCDTELTSRVTGMERSWAELIAPEHFRYQLGDQSEANCYPEGETLKYEVVFLTPEGSYDAATLDLSVSDDAAEVFRLELAP